MKYSAIFSGLEHASKRRSRMRNGEEQKTQFFHALFHSRFANYKRKDRLATQDFFNTMNFFVSKRKEELALTKG